MTCVTLQIIEVGMFWGSIQGIRAVVAEDECNLETWRLSLRALLH